MSAIYLALRMAHCEHHCIFCLPRENASALIVTIFHERTDLIVFLAIRGCVFNPSPAIARSLFVLCAIKGTLARGYFVHVSFKQC